MSARMKAKREAILAAGEMKVPDFSMITADNPRYKWDILYALNYANYTFDSSTQKEFANDYAKEKFGHSLSCVPDWELGHIGNICWLLKNECELRDIELYDKRIQDLYKKYKVDKKETVKKTPLIEQRTNTVIGELEGIIDDVNLQKEDITNPIDLFRNVGNFKVPIIEERFAAQLKEIQEDFPEEYPDSDLTIAALSVILNHIEVYKEELDQRTVRRTKRKARKKKIIPSKMVKRLKYKKTCEDYKLKSIQAEQIVGARILWIFNTKNRKITQYVSEDKVGLMVKGSSLLNWDMKKSKEKKLKIKDIESFINGVNDAGKVELRTILDTVKGKEKEPNGRINKNHILLRV